MAPVLLVSADGSTANVGFRSDTSTEVALRPQ